MSIREHGAKAGFPALAFVSQSYEEYLYQRFSRMLHAGKKVVFEETDDPAYLHQYQDLRRRLYCDAIETPAKLWVARLGKLVLAACVVDCGRAAHHVALPDYADSLNSSRFLAEAAKRSVFRTAGGNIMGAVIKVENTPAFANA